MTAEVRGSEQEEPIAFEHVEGWVVLLDAEQAEVVARQDCEFRYQLQPGGAGFSLTSRHEFDVAGKAISYLAVGRDDLMFLSMVAGRPVTTAATYRVGG